mgnify:FL=1
MNLLISLLIQKDWFQVDFVNETRLSKIATQGSIFNGIDSYINTFKVQTSLDGVSFATYQKNGKDWVSRQSLILTPL